MNLTEFIQSIDWIFAAIILIGGRYWGSKYFVITKNGAWNFLAFATVFGAIWLLIKYLTDKELNLASVFLTYLFTTSFYELLAKKLFEGLEKLVGKKDETTS